MTATVTALPLVYAGHRLTGTLAEFHAAVDQLEADTVPERFWQKVKFSQQQRQQRTPRRP